MINVFSCAIEENDSDLSDCSREIVKYNFSNKYTIVDWMPPLAKSIFDKKSFIKQEMIKTKISQYSFQIASLLITNKKDKKKISTYLYKIANNNNPINENPLLAIEDNQNKYHNIAINISNILYKIITKQIIFVNQSVVYSKYFNIFKKRDKIHDVK